MRTHHTPLAALALLAGATAVQANPVTWYTNAGPINSRGLLGHPNNATVVLPLPAIAPGGGSVWNYLTISGSLTRVDANTFASEACIEVTLPGGGKFVIKPFENGSFNGTLAIPAGSNVAPPYSMNSAGGQCTLRFFELFADNAAGADATWSNLTLTLHDTHGDDAFPFTSTPLPTPGNPDRDIDGNWFTKGQAVNAQFTNFSTDRVVDAFRFMGFGTAMCGWTANASSSPLSYVRYTFTADRADGEGTVSWTVAPFAQYAASTSSFDTTLSTPVPVLTGPTHPWSYTLAESSPPPLAADGTRMAAIWIGVQPLGPDAPAATDLGVIRGKPALGPAESTVVESETFHTLAHEVHWYTFTTEHACSNATGYWLDIHTQIPDGSLIMDQELGLYTPSGARVAFDDDGGSNARSMLTFGDSSPVRPPVLATGGPYPRDGHNGPLPAGLHYLAVPQFNAEFAATSWYINVEGALAGQMAFEFRTNLPAGACSPADVGSAGGVAGPDGVLDNNDFIAFITAFFNLSPSADVGIAGGLMGSDGVWDNNDFIAFINQFFAGCP